MALSDFTPKRAETAGDTYLIAEISLRYSTKTSEWFLECDGAAGSTGAFRRNLNDVRTIEFVGSLMQRIKEYNADT